MTTPVHRSRRFAVVAVSLAALSMPLAACSDDDDETPTTTDDTTQTDAEDAAPAAADPVADDTDNTDTQATGGNVVEIVMRDFEFANVPDSVPAGTQITVINEAEDELHEVVAFRLPDDEERPVSELVHLDPDALTAVLGEPATVLLAAPSGPQIDAVGDGTLTEPGRYAIMCFIPTGADVDEYLAAAAQSEGGAPEVEGGPPHFVHGMFAELLVE